MTQKSLFWCLLGLVLLIGTVLRASHVYDQHRLTPNERAYLYYAGRIHDEGIGVNRALYAEYIDNPDLWALAPPVRIGYVMVLEAAMEVMGTKNVEAGMTVSFVSGILTLLLVAWMGIRFFNPWVGLIASALCATSFIEIWLVRGTPQDGFFGLLGLLAVWIACEIMRTPRRLWLYIVFHMVGVWAVLVKQSGVFIYGFAALWLTGFLFFRERDVRRAMLLVVSVAAGVAVACGIWAALAGGVYPAWRVYQLGFLCNDETWSYQYECCFGPWTQVPVALFLLSPLTFLLAVAGIFALMMRRTWGSTLTSLQRNSGAICAAMAMGFVFLFSFFPNMQILRYISPGDGPVCLLGGIGLWCMLSLARQRLARVEYGLLLGLTVVGIAFSMVRDYKVFNKVAMQAGIPELGAEQIRSAVGQ